jgi:predicted nucleotidyltransferase
MPANANTTSQWHLIQQWLEDLKQLEAVDVVWLEGSLARGQGNPSSDIDIRFGIADVAYEQLWQIDRTPLLSGLGKYLLLE